MLVFGLGVNGGGVGAARFFAALGYHVTVTDAKSRKELARSVALLKGLPIRYALGAHHSEDFDTADLIIKNPAIPDSSPYCRRARSRGIPVVNDAEIFLSIVPRDRVIGITGTKGKTTTTTLLAHLLGPRAMALGTPGVSFFEYFFRRREPKFAIIECSSFDLELVSQSPHGAIITSLFADHLNRYSSFAAYAKAKMNLLKFQRKGDWAMFADDANIKKYLPRTAARRLAVGKRDIDAVRPYLSWRVSPASAALAFRAAQEAGVSDVVAKRRLKTYEPPSGRLEIVARKEGRVFINDTTATNPGAARHSLELIMRKYPKTLAALTLITGGEDKGFPAADVNAYARALEKSKARILLFPGSFSDKLAKSLRVRFERVPTMADAVREAVRGKGVIALLPAAASFNMFANEFDRADQFITAARRTRL